MKKTGQPGSAVEITAGHRIILDSLRAGIADGEIQAMAANWLRDLYAHHGIPADILMLSGLYRDLYTRSIEVKSDMDLAREWIVNLVQGVLLDHERRAKMTEDELIAKGQRETLPGANTRQVGGLHYQKPIQHWDFVGSNDYGYLEGQVTKYLFRWRDKNGLQDLEKATHFLQKLGEVAESDVTPINLQVFLDANDIPEEERSIYVALHAYHGTLDPTFLEYARAALARVVAKARRTVPHQPV